MSYSKAGIPNHQALVEMYKAKNAQKAAATNCYDPTAQYIQAGLGMLGQILCGVANADGSSRRTSEAAPSPAPAPAKPTTRKPEEINAEIQKIFDKYDVAFDPNHQVNDDVNISDIELVLAKKEQQYQEDYAKYGEAYEQVKAKNTELGQKNERMAQLNQSISTTQGKIDNIDGQIGEINTLIERVRAGTDPDASARINELEGQKSALQAQKEAKLGELNELRTQRDSLQGEIDTLTNDINTLNTENVQALANLETEINGIKEDLQKLKDLKNELFLADGSSAIRKLTNNETAVITNIVKNLTAARQANNQADIEKYTQELDNAIQSYYEKHKVGDNKTIDMFAGKILKLEIKAPSLVPESVERPANLTLASVPELNTQTKN